MKKWIALFGVLFLVSGTVACVRMQGPSLPNTGSNSQNGSTVTTFGSTVSTVTTVGKDAPTSSTPSLTPPTTLPPAPTTRPPLTTAPVPPTTVPAPSTTAPVPPTTVPVPPTTEPRPTRPVEPDLPIGWIQDEDRWYYVHADGTVAVGFTDIDGGRYYFDISGVMHTGWLDLEDGRYYFSPGGLMQTGWILVEGNRYYLNDAGHMQIGWVDVDNNRYYLNEDGTVYTGWIFHEGNMLYLKENGAMARGRVEIEGETYFFTSTGVSIMLVNPWNKLPEGYEPDLVAVDKYGTYDDDDDSPIQYVDAICYDDLMQMMADCKKNSQEAVVVSSYRTVAYQEYLFEKRVKRFMNEEGYSREEAEILAAQRVAVPGTSEHHLGLAVDIVDNRYWKLDEKQAEMPAQKWLMENSWKYGFILRYPVGTTEVTGIIYEPWHYRYVGKELAAELYELGLTLEEYLQKLTDEAAQ